MENTVAVHHMLSSVNCNGYQLDTQQLDRETRETREVIPNVVSSKFDKRDTHNFRYDLESIMTALIQQRHTTIERLLHQPR